MNQNFTVTAADGGVWTCRVAPLIGPFQSNGQYDYVKVLVFFVAMVDKYIDSFKRLRSILKATAVTTTVFTQPLEAKPPLACRSIIVLGTQMILSPMHAASVTPMACTY